MVADARGVERVKGVSFAVRRGEIVGVAGVAGNGQSELLEALAGHPAAEVRAHPMEGPRPARPPRALAARRRAGSASRTCPRTGCAWA